MPAWLLAAAQHKALPCPSFSRDCEPAQQRPFPVDWFWLETYTRSLNPATSKTLFVAAGRWISHEHVGI